MNRYCTINFQIVLQAGLGTLLVLYYSSYLCAGATNPRAPTEAGESQLGPIPGCAAGKPQVEFNCSEQGCTVTGHDPRVDGAKVPACTAALCTMHPETLDTPRSVFISSKLTDVKALTCPSNINYTLVYTLRPATFKYVSCSGCNQG